MSRDQILSTLLSLGAVSLIKTIQDVEAGRIRRVRIERIPGDPVFTGEVMRLLYSLGADVEIARPVWPSCLRRTG